MHTLTIGFGLGFLVAMQLGPMSLFLIRSTLRGGWGVGLAIGGGIALVDALYAAAGAAGAASLLAIDPLRTAFSLLGAAVLLVIGVRTLRDAFRVRLGVETDDEVASPRRAFATSVGATASNPLTIASWAAIFAAASGRRRFAAAARRRRRRRRPVLGRAARDGHGGRPAQARRAGDPRCRRVRGRRARGLRLRTRPTRGLVRAVASPAHNPATARVVAATASPFGLVTASLARQALAYWWYVCACRVPAAAGRARRNAWYLRPRVLAAVRDRRDAFPAAVPDVVGRAEEMEIAGVDEPDAELLVVSGVEQDDLTGLARVLLYGPWGGRAAAARRSR